jgi:hypothetical protein
MIEGGQFGGGGLVGIEPVGEQAITGFRIGDAVQGVFDDPHHRAVLAASPVGLVAVERGEIRAVRQIALARQALVALDPEQELGAALLGLLPKLQAEVEAVGQ